MENKRWIIVILFLVVGIATIREGLKNMSWMHPDSAAIQIDLGMQPFLSPAVPRKTKYQAIRDEVVAKNLEEPCNDPAGCGTLTPEGDLDAHKESEEGPKKKKGKNETDKKKKKKKKNDKDKKKKKKKKKSSKKRKKRSNEEIAKSDDPSGTSPKQDGETASPRPQGVSTIVIHNPKDKKDQQDKEESEEELIEKWRADLLSKPNPEKVNEFIDLYLIRKIPENVFYTLALEMAFDERTEMVGYGILCLGSTPSVRSFQELVTIESSSEIPDWAKSDATRYLQGYTQLHHVRLLTRILTQSKSSSITIRATQLLMSSAQRNISALRSPTSQSSEGSMDRETQTRSIESYNNALSTLARLRESQDGDVKEAMGQAYETISSLLNG